MADRAGSARDAEAKRQGLINKGDLWMFPARWNAERPFSEKCFEHVAMLPVEQLRRRFAKRCRYPNYVHYAATDRGLLELYASCPTCTHVLVTNADNMCARARARRVSRRHADASPHRPRPPTPCGR